MYSERYGYNDGSHDHDNKKYYYDEVMDKMPHLVYGGLEDEEMTTYFINFIDGYIVGDNRIDNRLRELLINSLSHYEGRYCVDVSASILREFRNNSGVEIDLQTLY